MLRAATLFAIVAHLIVAATPCAPSAELFALNGATKASDGPTSVITKLCACGCTERPMAHVSPFGVDYGVLPEEEASYEAAPRALPRLRVLRPPQGWPELRDPVPRSLFS